MPEAAAVEAAVARAAAPDAPRATTAATKLVLVNAAAGALLVVYLWQIFNTMPHVAVLSSDSGTYLHLTPFRTAGIYYFSRAVFAWWNNFYGIAIAQGSLLGAASLLLFYALYRTTGSAVLALSTLTICLFKASWIIETQSVESDSLFETACVALLAATVLVWKKPSPVHIGLFVLFGLVALIIRPIGPAIVWPLVLVLALRLWWVSRRALTMIVAGCIGLHGVNAAIEFVHFGIPAPAQLGYALIGGTGFIADENASSDIPYAREFASSTAAYRNEYTAASWEQKFAIMGRYYGQITWKMAFPRLFALLGNGPRPSWAELIAVNRGLEGISFAAIRNNPAGYGQMTLVKLAAGASMFLGDSKSDLQREFTRDVADQRIDFVPVYLDWLPLEPPWTRFGHDDERTRLAAYIRDWQTTPLDLKHDVARPLRDLVGLLTADTIDRLFIFETVVLAVVAIGMAVRRKRVEDWVAFLLLFIVPPWCNLLAVSLTHIPLPRYMEPTSLFVYLALAVGAWVAVTGAAKRVPVLRGGSGAGATS
jgi:hypothetical protein